MIRIRIRTFRFLVIEPELLRRFQRILLLFPVLILILILIVILILILISILMRRSGQPYALLRPDPSPSLSLTPFRKAPRHSRSRAA